MSPGAGGPEFGHQGLDGLRDLLGRQALRQVGLEHVQFGRLLVDEVGAAGLREGRDGVPCAA